MKEIEAANLEELWKNTVNECKESSNTLENVVLHCEFPVSEIDSKFITINKSDAEMWERDTKPDELVINHGQYINKGTSAGIEFVVKELKKKTHGNRACYSLINMNDIVDSKDNVIPSFLVLQFSFSKNDQDKLLVSAYFRALEVENFLPINLAEICLNIKKIQENFPNIKNIELNIFAFRAQLIKNFYCLKHAKIDILNLALITKYLLKDKKIITELLFEKKTIVESVVVTTGMENLLKAVDALDIEDLENKEDIKNKIIVIIEEMNRIKEMRTNTSIHEDIKTESDKLSNKIGELITLME